jgi:subtilase family serine protease
MRTGALRTLLASTGALFTLIALPCASAGAALSPSAYGVGALCSAPAPGYAGCLGLRLVAKRPLSLSGAQESTRAAHTASPAVKQIEFKQPWEESLSPQNVLTAYGLSAVPAPAAQQTLALVDAYTDSTAEGDLQVFDEQYGLPPCTTANGCFTKVALGTATEAGWAQETATDIEVAHGLCESCKILLVEANSNDNTDLEAAEEKAEQLGATEISNSWGGPDEGVTAEEDRHSPFDHPGTVITAAAGDDGYLDWDAEESSERGFADYPASSPHVVAVGGTHLSLTAGAWQEETVWNGAGAGAGGGGCATKLTAPAWQQSLADWSSVGCGSRRAVADVSADADPYSG